MNSVVSEDEKSDLRPGAFGLEWRTSRFRRVMESIRPSSGQDRPSLLTRVVEALREGSGLFDWYEREGIIPPSDQKKFAYEIFWPLTDEIIRRERELGRRYRRTLLLQAMQVFELGCVRARADPQAATEQVQLIHKRIEEFLLRRQRERSTLNFLISFFFAIVTAAAGIYASSRSWTVGGVGLANFFFVAAACMATDAVMTRGLVAAETILDYEKKKHMLDLPLLRVITLAVGVELFAIVLWKGGLQLRIGSIDVQMLDKDVFVAIVVGAADGFLGSDLLKLLVDFFRRSVGRSTTGRSRTR